MDYIYIQIAIVASLTQNKYNNVSIILQAHKKVNIYFILLAKNYIEYTEYI